MSLVNRRSSVTLQNHARRTMSRRHEWVFDDPDASAELAELEFVVVPADKTSNNIILGLFAKRISTVYYCIKSSIARY